MERIPCRYKLRIHNIVRIIVSFIFRCCHCRLSQWQLLRALVLAKPLVMPQSFPPNTASCWTESSSSWTMPGPNTDRQLLVRTDLTRSAYRPLGTAIHCSPSSRLPWDRLRRSGTVAHPPVYVHCIAARHLHPCHLHINAHTSRARPHWVCYSSLSFCIGCNCIR